MNFYVKIDDDEAIASLPAVNSGACEDNVEFIFGDLQGYKPGEDLEIQINVENPTVYNNFYVGFIRGASTNVLPFYDDYNVNYALVDNTANAVSLLNGGSSEIGCFVDGQGFMDQGSGHKASVTIDGSCLTSGAYQLYVVYDTPEGSKFCLSQPIVQKASARNVILGTHTCEIEHNDEVFSDCCVTGLANVGTTKVCISLNRTSFEAAMSAEGYSGTMEDYFVSAKMFVGGNQPSEDGIGVTGAAGSSTS